MPTLRFKNIKTVRVSPGVSILDAALSSGIELHHTCGGHASCSTCRVKVIRGMENLSPVETAEAQVLDTFDLQSPFRLGCQAVILGRETEVEIPLWTREPRPNKTPEVPR